MAEKQFFLRFNHSSASSSRLSMRYLCIDESTRDRSPALAALSTPMDKVEPTLTARVSLCPRREPLHPAPHLWLTLPHPAHEVRVLKQPGVGELESELGAYFTTFWRP